MAKVHSTDRKGAERLAQCTVCRSASVIGDGGEGDRPHVACARHQQAAGVLQSGPATVPLEHADGQPCAAPAWVRTQRAREAAWSGGCRIHDRR